MTAEQREIRKAISQMLADNGVNRETIKDLVLEVINEKVDKSTSSFSVTKEVDSAIKQGLKSIITDVVREEIRRRINGWFTNVSVMVKLEDPHEKFENTKN